MKVLWSAAAAASTRSPGSSRRSAPCREVLCAPGNRRHRLDRANASRSTPAISAALVGLRRSANASISPSSVRSSRSIAGIVDLFTSRGLRIFGPSRAAAQLECSKVFAKAFMARHGIPTARYRVCDDAADAHAIVASGELGFPIVVKADGLAAGKGVVVAPDRARRRIARFARRWRSGSSATPAARVVLEECLDGPEVSFFAICDGTRAAALMSAQDHKRVFDGDEGPNTGGMGAFAPSPLVDAAMQARIMREIVDPVVRVLRAERPSSIAGSCMPA